jgi:hypothetical protein
MGRLIIRSKDLALLQNGNVELVALDEPPKVKMRIRVNGG